MLGNLSLPSILTIIFVVCKLAGWIDWSWWTVFAPTWIAAIVVSVWLLILLLIAAIVAWLE